MWLQLLLKRRLRLLKLLALIENGFHFCQEIVIVCPLNHICDVRLLDYLGPEVDLLLRLQTFS